MIDNNTLNSLDYQSSSPEVETEQDTMDHAPPEWKNNKVTNLQ